MIPTSRDVLGRQLWSAAYAVLVGSITALLAVAVVPERARLVGGIVVGVAAAIGWYHRGMAPIRRRRRLLARGLSAADRDFLQHRVRLYARLSTALKHRCEALCTIILSEVRIQGVGCELTREDHLLIAVSAAIPILGFPDWEYDGLKEVLVYPRSFDGPEAKEEAGDAVGMVFSGDGLMEGMVILSLPDLRDGYADADDWSNVGIHEFAHLVDRVDGTIDGLPPGQSAGDRAAWRAQLAEAHRNRVGRGFLPDHAFENGAEYFAVLAECFFEDPAHLHRWNPELYALLTRTWRQDPLAGQRA